MVRKGKEIVPEITIPKEKGRKTRSSTRNEEVGQGSRPKKSKGSSSSRGRQDLHEEPPIQAEDIPKHHLENKYGIQFEYNKDSQKAKYDIMYSRGIVSTRFLDDQLMCELGLDDNLQWMFEKLGLGMFWGARYDTYPKYVLEFFSSVSIFNNWISDSTRRQISFRCDGKDWHLTAREFNAIYGFHDGGLMRRDGDITGSELWPLISDELKFEAGHSKCTSIRNPVFRCFQKAIANTVLARSDSQNVMRTEELYFIWACFKSEVPVDMGFHFLSQLNNIANRKKGPITIGGMLTPLFLHCGVDISGLETAAGPNILSYDVFHASGLFSKRQNSTYLNDPYILLPCYYRLDITNPKNWKVGELVDDDDEVMGDDADDDEEEEEEEQEENAGAYNLGDIRNSLKEIREEQRRTSDTLHQFGLRQQRLEERFDTMYQWNEAIYHHFFPPPPPPPTA